MRSVSDHRRVLLGVVAVVTSAALLCWTSGCGAIDPSRPSSADAPDYQPAGAAALPYGQAPERHPDVTFHPDVVLVGGGGGSVRSVTADGLTWRIDPAAERAGELERGRVMFLTGRAVGRVLDVRREGRDLAVTIGPVELTEVIRDGTFATSRPVPLEGIVAYPAGEPFWADPAGAATEPVATPRGGKVPGRFSMGEAPYAPRRSGLGPRPANDRPVQPPPQTGGHPNARAGGFHVQPSCCAGGVGAHFTYDTDGVRLSGSMELLLNKPSGSFELVIGDGGIKTARFRIAGGAGLRVRLEGASAIGQNVGRRLQIPVDFTVPLGLFLGVPFSATVNQSLEVRTAFGAQNGNITAAGEFSFEGAIGFGYANGSFGTQVPQGLQMRSSLTESVNGISMGVNGLVVAYQARFHVGIGAFGFTTGLYAGLTASVGVTVGSAAGSPIAVCRGASLNLFASFGIGYTMPAPVAEVINFFLKTFRAKPIQRSGGRGVSVPVFKRNDLIPKDTQLCRV